MRKYVNTKLDELIVGKRSLNGLKSQKEKRVDELAAQYSDLDKSTPEVIKMKLREQIKEIQNEVINIDDQLQKINRKIIDLTQEKFLNHLNSLGLQMRAVNMP